MYWQCSTPRNTSDSQRRERWVFTWEDHFQLNRSHQSCSSPRDETVWLLLPTGVTLRSWGTLEVHGPKTAALGKKDCLKWHQEELWHVKFEWNTHHSLCYLRFLLWNRTTEKGGETLQREENVHYKWTQHAHVNELSTSSVLSQKANIFLTLGWNK